MTVINPSMPLLQVYAGNQSLFVTDPEMTVFIGTNPPQPDEVTSLAFIHYENPTPFGVGVIPTTYTTGHHWKAIVSEGEVGIINGLGERSLVSPPNLHQIGNKVFNHNSYICLLTEGLNIFLFGTERVHIIVHPENAQVIQAGSKIDVKSKDQIAHEEEEKIEKQLQQQNLDLKARSEMEALNRKRSIEKRLVDAALPENTDQHNVTAMLQSLRGRLLPPVPKGHAQLGDRNAFYFHFHPKTGKIIAFLEGTSLPFQTPEPVLEKYPRAILHYDPYSKKMVGVTFEPGTPPMKALERLPELFNNQPGFRR